MISTLEKYEIKPLLLVITQSMGLSIDSSTSLVILFEDAFQILDGSGVKLLTKLR